MKCPLLGIGAYATNREEGDVEWNCLEKECAWWGTWTTERSEEQSGCCLPILTSILSEVMSKMPHEEQFRK